MAQRCDTQADIDNSLPHVDSSSHDDVVVPRDNQVRGLVFLKEPPLGFQHGKGGAWKPAKILYFLARYVIGNAGPRFEPFLHGSPWFFMVDDDSYFIPQNLNFTNDAQPLRFIAPPLTAGMKIPWAENFMRRDGPYSFTTSCIQGGAGIQMNAPAVLTLGAAMSNIRDPWSFFLKGEEETFPPPSAVRSTSDQNITMADTNTTVPWNEGLPSAAVAACSGVCEAFQFGDVRVGCCANVLRVPQRAIPGFYWLPPNEFRPRGTVKASYRELALQEYTAAASDSEMDSPRKLKQEPPPMVVNRNLDESTSSLSADAEGNIFSVRKRLSVNRFASTAALLSALPRTQGAATFGLSAPAPKLVGAGDMMGRLRSSVRASHPYPISFHKLASTTHVFAIHTAATAMSQQGRATCGNASVVDLVNDNWGTQDGLLSDEGGNVRVLDWSPFDAMPP